MVARDLPVGGERSLASARAPGRFDMVGVRWRGPGTCASGRARWPGAGGPGRRPTTRTRAGSGTSDGLAVPRARARRRLRAYYIWSPVEHQSLRRLAVAGSPPIVSRPAWGADELLRRNQPRYAPAVRLVFVHHTATSERVHAGPGGRDRARNRRLPRQGERLERHRLQLPRRPLRAGLRGPCGGITAQRHRRARARVQHGQRRDRADRQLHDGKADVRGRPVARAADRVAARPRARRSGLDAHVRLRTAASAAERREGQAARRLRTPRHGRDELPGDVRSIRS